MSTTSVDILSRKKDSDILSTPSRDHLADKSSDILSKPKDNEKGSLPEGKQDFDLALVSECFTKCNHPDGTLCLGEYLKAYHELCRFFKLMGTLFGFVAEDIEEKQVTLRALRSEWPSEYNTIQSLVHYEVANELTHKQIQIGKQKMYSGCRQLLRLHRALEFILGFMRKMATSPDEAKTSEIAAEVYEETLSKHHIWIIRKMAGLAMYTLPNRKDLIHRMCKQSYEEAHVLVEIAARNGQMVYDVTQSLLEEHNLLDIP